MREFPDHRAEPSWLAARREADVQARGQATTLVRRLEQRLAPGPAHGIDVGTGTGANHTFLTGLLSVDTHWSVLDHDPDLLDHPMHAGAVRKLTGIAEIPGHLGEHDHHRAFLTCSAVLDVLRHRDLEALVDVILSRGVPALFSLSVTGDVVLLPEDPLDHRITAAFNAHQRRDGRLGPDAAHYVAGRLPTGWLQQVQTPWRLRAVSHADLLRRYLTERAQSAIEQDPDLTEPTARWLELRLQQIEEGHLTVEVGHVDQLVLPA
jgi:hypothetical protein